MLSDPSLNIAARDRAVTKGKETLKTLSTALSFTQAVFLDVSDRFTG